MRRFLAYFNALFLGMILGLIFLAIVHAIPTLYEWPAKLCGFVAEQRYSASSPVIAVSVSVMEPIELQIGVLRKQPEGSLSGR